MATHIASLIRSISFITLAATLSSSSLSYANTQALLDLIAEPGSIGLGVIGQAEHSLYKGEETRHDIEPAYLYENKHFFLHGSRLGLKLLDEPQHQIKLLLDHRFEGFADGPIPPPLLGLHARNGGTDLGLSYRYSNSWGQLETALLHDVSDTSKGSEVRLAYANDWQSGRWHFRPSVSLSLRDAKLNNYYYGVQADEVSAGRAHYMPGVAKQLSLNLHAAYDLTARWRLLGGVGINLLDKNIADSPIVASNRQTTVSLGAVYDFGDSQHKIEAAQPLHAKLLYGNASDCNLLPVMTLRCTDTHTDSNTSIAGVHIGKTLIEKANDWPLDFVGYIGVLQHAENHYQSNSLQLDAYVKAFYYGFPWAERIRTRLGFGMGLSLAQRVPYVEQQDQIRRNRNTSKLLNYLDPSIDISVGDLIGSRRLKETYFGFGASHRSGIFGSSKLLGNVNGGSNYLYTYIETAM
ncbi:MAG: MipA/OmpV family protein [Pseudomonadota bacterium]